MTDKPIVPNSANEIDSFVEKMRSLPGHLRSPKRGRLMFAMDATASRERSWDRAMGVQSEMFLEADRLGGLDVQLVFYRGFKECKASRWTSSAAELVNLMVKVNCLAGKTQINRVLKQAINENSRAKVDALILICDACEEDIDHLGELAGQLGLLGTPVFAFQEGQDQSASIALKSIARLTKGAHLNLKDGSAAELRGLIGAVASFAAGGEPSLKALAKGSRSAKILLEYRNK